MIATNVVSVQFGGEYLFRDVTFMIRPGDRVGLVGANGAGKSTLMKILMRLQAPESGQVQTSRHALVAYLPQEGVVLSDASVRDEVMKAFSEAKELEQEIIETTEEVARRADEAGTPEYQSLLDDLGELQHRFEAMNGFALEGEVEKILMGLGFEVKDFDRSCGTFSGGWQMRIELAKLLLRQPDLLMLDEPTNHLDIESLTWLENFLQNYQGAILLISHDRAFLDAITNRTFELSMRRLTTYVGNYSRYLTERDARRQQQQSAYENQKKMIEETEEFIERFRYKASKAAQVQSRVKMLEKLDKIEPPESDEESVHFRFPAAPRSGRVVVELQGLGKWYGDNHVLDNVDFAIERGEKIAFLGRNGEGKSTMSRIVAGIESFQQGNRLLGHNVSIGYFAQHQAEDLDPRKTVLQTLDEVATGDIRLKLRTLLGAFLFHGDDVFKYVSVLSGGEKSRLALAKLLLEPVNLLVFDEPTNHLDMASKKVLKEALIHFDGSIILVSHDRDFLNGIVGKCIEFRQRKTKEMLGGIEDYLRRRQTGSIDDVFRKSTAKPEATATPAAAVGDRKEQKRLEAEARNRRYAATKDLKKKIEKTEQDIAKTEEAKTQCEDQLVLPEIYGNPTKLRDLQAQLAEANRKLSDLYAAWERTASEMEKVERELG
ncbi:MAG: ABC-F family ATP-binding cassette domain-containing protein [Armatimonadetes bacterium]|nr:ABC-F family ATP-binding cassette domain-containing protein [Armatimonadota bacterium]